MIALLNDLAATGRLMAVRGNCEAEVDQMVLDFPCMADSASILDEAGRELFCTHGHVFGAGLHNSVDRMPSLPRGSVLVYGHTHIKVNEACAGHPGLWLFNPGSVGAGLHNSVDRMPSLPRGSVLVYGHTHIKVNEACAGHPGLWLFNPGSVSIPKDGTNSCGVYDASQPIERAFSHILL